MDDLDFLILRQFLHPQSFQYNVRLSYAEVARVAGCDEETARARLRRMEEEGVIRGWQVVLNPGFFGRNWTRFDLAPIPPEARAKVEAALVAMDGAHLLMESLGGRFALVTYQTPGAATERASALLAAIAGGPPRVIPTSVPPSAVDLAPLDWRIVRAIRTEPRAPYAEVAGAVGASERTVRRRVDRLIEGRALVHDVDIDFGRIGGSVCSTIHVAMGDGAPREEIVGVLRSLPRVLFRELEGPRVRVSYAAENVPAAEAARRRVEEVARGRADVHLDLLLRRECLREWLDAEIATRTGG